jgi:ATP-dependent DNA ligase
LEQRNLEGMVAKKFDSQYTDRRTHDWLKVKTAAGKETMRELTILYDAIDRTHLNTFRCIVISFALDTGVGVDYINVPTTTHRFGGAL